jgi:hypothetical protein
VTSYPKQSKRADHLCAIFAKQTANWGIFNTVLMSMAAKENSAKHLIVMTQYAASHSLGALVFTAPHVKDSLIKIAIVVMTGTEENN